jgi:hypothetical protein
MSQGPTGILCLSGLEISGRGSTAVEKSFHLHDFGDRAARESWIVTTLT